MLQCSPQLQYWHVTMWHVVRLRPSLEGRHVLLVLIVISGSYMEANLLYPDSYCNRASFVFSCEV